MRTKDELREDLKAILTKAKFEGVEPYYYKDLIIQIAVESEVIFSEEFKLEPSETFQRTDKGRRNTFVIGLNKLIVRYNLI